MGHGDARGFDQTADDIIRAKPMQQSNSTNRADDQGPTTESVAGLLSGLIKDIQDLLRGELRLAKVELKEDTAAMGRGAAMVIAGALTGVIALVFLGLAAAALLDKWLETWLAVGIVMVAFAVIAAILASSGKKQLSANSLKPEQTIDSLKEDREWAKQQMNSVKG